MGFRSRSDLSDCKRGGLPGYPPSAVSSQKNKDQLYRRRTRVSVLHEQGLRLRFGGGFGGKDAYWLLVDEESALHAAREVGFEALAEADGLGGRRLKEIPHADCGGPCNIFDHSHGRPEQAEGETPPSVKQGVQAGADRVSQTAFAAFNDPASLNAERDNDRGKHEVMAHQFRVHGDALTAKESELLVANLLGIGNEPFFKATVFLPEFVLAIDTVSRADCDGQGHCARTKRGPVHGIGGQKKPQSIGRHIAPDAGHSGLHDETDESRKFAEEHAAPRS